jgi:dimethylhistidine N-methyltransferase
MASSRLAVSPRAPHAVTLHDCAPAPDDFRADVLQGLQTTAKSISCKYLYDAHGSQLFDQICELPEYYPTRTERDILCEYGTVMAQALGPNTLLIEYGSGSSSKTTLLLDALLETGCEPAAYIPIDISREHLLQSAQRLALQYAPLPVWPVCADYMRPFTLPGIADEGARRVIYFPGSTIGNFTSPEAQKFLQQMAEVCGESGGLLIGVDLKKDHDVLHRAYNDAQGITSAFNLNLLQRINREFGAQWPVENFRHVAFYESTLGRIEMHLESMGQQTLKLENTSIHFENGERIHTENSYKYALPEFAALAHKAGWNVQQVWTDRDVLFSVQFLTVA